MSSNAENIEQQAADWIVRQQSGDWSEAEQAGFDAWIAASVAHRVAYVRLETMWNEAGRLKAIAAGVPAGTLLERGTWGATRSGRAVQLSKPQSIQAGTEVVSDSGLNVENSLSLPDRRMTSRARGFAIAASAVIAVFAGLYATSVHFNAAGRHTTAVGAIDTVPLSDGSSVTLNTDSRIRVEYGEHERRIELDRGEAFFQVEKDPRRPFVVMVGQRRVVAVGTQFAVRRQEDDIRVAVTQGLVRVERPGSSADRTSPEILLGAGSVAQTVKAEVIVKDHVAPQVEQLLSWRQGYVAFRETALADAVAEFNRYNSRKIVIRDPAISAIHVGGNFKSTNTQAFLWMLQNGFAIDVEETEGEVILKSR